MAIVESSKEKIGRQIVLPFSKAVEISVKSIKVRFGRSLITMAGIILAIAFLASIWMSSDFYEVLRDTMEKPRPGLNLAAMKNPPKEPEPPGRRKAKEKEEAYRKRCTQYESDHAAYEKERAAYRQYRDTTFLAQLKKADSLDLLAIGDTPRQMQRALSEIKKKLVKAGRPPLDVVTGDAAETEKGKIKNAKILAARKEERAKKLWLIIIALLVCTVGITNSMLMAVTERFREIGTMKCLGALDSFILKLFVLESSFQGVTGTVIGIVLGFLVSFVMAFVSYRGYAWSLLPIGPLAVSAGWALLIGSILSVLAAIYPAMVAARMQPVEAMRVEA